jgi:hypothetical protein
VGGRSPRLTGPHVCGGASGVGHWNVTGTGAVSAVRLQPRLTTWCLWAEGGRDELSNAMSLCKRDHSRKTMRELRARGRL